MAEEPPLAWATATRAQQIVEPLGHSEEQPLPESLNYTHCCLPILEGSRKQEMSDCKGIKILLAICPSNDRGEDLLSQPKVFWNLRLSHVSFRQVCFCCPSFQHAGLPLTSPALGFLSVQLPPREFCRVGFLLCLASVSLGLS